MIDRPHEHDVTLDDAFDFINTLEYEDSATGRAAATAVDHLETSADAVGWLADHRLLHAEPARHLLDAHGSSTALLDRVRDLRSALREVVDAVAHQRAPDPAALARVNETLRARSVVVLEPDDDGVKVGHRHEGDPLDDALARLAEPIVGEIAGGRPERLRVCANDACRWVFFDASPTGRRRWCSMASCGNRAKAARHRARLKGASTS